MNETGENLNPSLEGGNIHTSEEDYLDTSPQWGEGFENVLKNDPETMQQARELILKSLSQYNPKDSLSELPLAGLVEQLNNHFFTNGFDEATGFLEYEIVELIIPILDQIQAEYPDYLSAVQRFRHLYCSAAESEAINKSDPDPYRYILDIDEERIISYYTSPECQSEKAAGFAIRLVHCGKNNEVGIKIISSLIEQWGWNQFLELVGQVHTNGNERGSLFGSIVEVMYKLGNLSNLPKEEVEKVYSFAQNDLEWIELKTYLDTRQDVQDLKYYNDPLKTTALLRDFDVPFWDEERAKQEAIRLMQYSDIYHNVLNDLAEYGYSFDESENPETIFSQLPPVFAFNYVAQYTPDDIDYFTPDELHESEKGKLIRSLVLPNEQLQEKVRGLMSNNSEAFGRVMFETEFQQKSRQAAVLSSGKYDLLAPAEAGCSEEGKTGVGHWGYLLNSSAMRLAEDTTGVYSPTGRLLSVLKTPDSEEVKSSRELADFLSMKHALSDNKNFSAVENSTAVMLIFWNRFPTRWQEHIEEMFGSYQVDIHEWVNEVPDAFELATRFSVDLVPIVARIEGFTEALQRYVDESTEEIRNELSYASPIDDNELLILMNTEYGQTSLTEKDVHDTVRSLSFSAVKNLSDTFKLDFGELKRREFFGLLQYLKQSKDGQGFKNLKKIAETSPDKESTIQRIRVFMSLEKGDPSLGDAIVEFSENQDIADKVFSYYSELLDSAERAEALVKEVSDCEGNTCSEQASQVRENILNRAQKDLEAAVRSHDASSIEAQIGNYVARAKEYVALLQEVGSGKTEKVTSSELALADQNQIRELLKNNFGKEYPEPKDDEFKEAVAGSLEKGFSNPNTTFHILRDGEKIVSSNRFDTVTDYIDREVTYFGSFNADPAYSGVGGVMLELALKERLTDGRPMMAHCDPTKAITRKYIEDGFIATQYYPIAGKSSFEIWRTGDSGSVMESKGMTDTALLNRSESDGSIIVREQSQAEDYPELRDGKALTRYFTQEGKTYLVFETLPTELKNQFVVPQAEEPLAA